eukprot:TRINITY_DN90355_c0_g1_i1.p1 TRINITY_DN90355_c0_g1~~TRINITY_DN90355_c0_g1_i1.p1  ORF type:complete len:2275 (-),score=526.12 TRINITY_DN90355_c0_g1_i1:98-6922(-)
MFGYAIFWLAACFFQPPSAEGFHGLQLVQIRILSPACLLLPSFAALVKGQQTTGRMGLQFTIGAADVDDDATGRTVSSSDQDTIRFGSIMTMDIRLPDGRIGRDTYWTFEIFFKWLNEVRGGIYVNNTWRKASVTCLDDQGDADTAEAATKYLVNDLGINLIIGPHSSNLSEQVASVVHDTRALALLPGASPTSVFEDRPNVFGTYTPAARMTDSAFEALDGKITTVAYFMEDTPLQNEQCDAAKSLSLQRNVTMLEEITVSASDTDLEFKNKVAQLKRADAELLIGCTYRELCERFVIEAIKQDYAPNILLTFECVTSPGFLERLQAATGVNTAGRWIWGITPWTEKLRLTSNVLDNRTSESFVQEFKKKHKSSPTWESAYCWAAMTAYVVAIEEANSLDPAVIAARLGNMSIKTVIGRVFFDRNGQNLNPYKVVQWRAVGNEPSVILPKALAEYEPFWPLPSWQSRDCRDALVVADYGFPFGGGAGGRCSLCTGDAMATWDMAAQMRICLPCSDGLVALRNQDGSRRCLASCGDGQVPDFGRDPTVNCRQCRAGTIPRAGYVQCADCDPGRFSEGGSVTACSNCAAGKYADSPGMGSCTLCPAGRADSREGLIECKKCTFGKYQDVAGQPHCARCPAGNVSKAVGVSVCVACKVGTYSRWDSQECESCPVGKYQSMTGQTACIDAGTHEGTVAPEVGMATPHNLEGWYMFKPKFDSLVRVEFCRFQADACKTKERCADGHTGRQCLTCVPGWAMGETGCFKCPPLAYTAIMTTLQIVGCIAFGIFMAHMVVEASNSPQRIHSILFKQFLNHLIMMSVFGVLLKSVLAYRGMQKDMPVDLWYLEASRLVSDFFYICDGTLPSEWTPWSITCLVQPQAWKWDPEENKAVEDLINYHSMFYDDKLSKGREVLHKVLLHTEVRRMLLWGIWPFALTCIAYAFGYALTWSRLQKTPHDYEKGLEWYLMVARMGFEQARKLHLKKDWMRFLNLYNERIFSIWWPMAHCLHYQFKKRLHFFMFMEESYPVHATIVWMAFGSAVRGVLRPMRCAKLTDDNIYGGEEPSYLMQAGELKCFEDPPWLFMISAFLFFLWGVVFPVTSWFRLFAMRHIGWYSQQEEMNRKWGLMINGYKADRWWWETVIFARKTTMFILEIVNMREEVRVLLYVILAGGCLLTHLACDPYDKRCFGILDRLERYHLLLFMLCSFTLRVLVSPAGNEKLLVAAPLFLLLLNYAYLVLIVFHLVRHIVLNATTNFSKEIIIAEKDGFMKEVKILMLDAATRDHRMAPYTSFDSDYKWIGLCRNGGDLCTPPYIAKGRIGQDESGADIVIGRIMRLTEAPAVPEPVAYGPMAKRRVRRPRRRMRRELLQSLQGAINQLTQITPAFSCTVLEFVYRGAFVLAREREHRYELTKQPAEDVDAEAWVLANINKDPLCLQGVNNKTQTSAVDGGGALMDSPEDVHYLTLGKVLEEEILSSTGYILTGRQQGTARGTHKDAASYLLTSTIEQTREQTKAMADQFGVGVIHDAVVNAQDAVVGGTVKAAVQTTANIAHVGVKVGTHAKNVATTVGVAAKDTVKVAGEVVEVTQAVAKVMINQGEMADITRSRAASSYGQEVEMVPESEDDNIAAARREQGEQMEKRREDRLRAKYVGYTKRMFDPMVFKLGLPMSDFEFALVQLMKRPNREMQLWLDIFEEMLVEERRTLDRTFRRTQGFVVDKECQTETVFVFESEQHKLHLMAVDLVAGSKMVLHGSVNFAKTHQNSTWNAEMLKTGKWLFYLNGVDGELLFLSAPEERTGDAVLQQLTMEEAMSTFNCIFTLLPWTAGQYMIRLADDKIFLAVQEGANDMARIEFVLPKGVAVGSAETLFIISDVPPIESHGTGFDEHIGDFLSDDWTVKGFDNVGRERRLAIQSSKSTEQEDTEQHPGLLFTVQLKDDKGDFFQSESRRLEFLDDLTGSLACDVVQLKKFETGARGGMIITVQALGFLDMAHLKEARQKIDNNEYLNDMKWGTSHVFDGPHAVSVAYAQSDWFRDCKALQTLRHQAKVAARAKKIQEKIIKEMPDVALRWLMLVTKLRAKQAGGLLTLRPHQLQGTIGRRQKGLHRVEHAEADLIGVQETREKVDREIAELKRELAHMTPPEAESRAASKRTPRTVRSPRGAPGSKPATPGRGGGGAGKVDAGSQTQTNRSAEPSGAHPKPSPASRGTPADGANSHAAAEQKPGEEKTDGKKQDGDAAAEDAGGNEGDNTGPSTQAKLLEQIEEMAMEQLRTRVCARLC